MTLGGGRGVLGTASLASLKSAGLTVDEVALVSAAIERLAVSRDWSGSETASWHVDSPIKRQQALVIPIRFLLGEDEAVHLFLKKLRPAADNPGRHARYLAAVERGPILSERVTRLGATRGVGVGRVLAADPERLATVTLGVQGEPLRKAWSRAFGLQARSRVLTVYQAIGDSIAVIESASLGDAEAVPYVEESRLGALVESASPYLRQEVLKRLGAAIRGLSEEWRADPAPFYHSHGDLNRSNILIDGSSINLIDFDWSPRPRSFDLAMLLLRLEMERPRLNRWTRSVSDRVVDGYGDPDVRASAPYLLVRLKKLTSGVRSAGRSGNRGLFRRFSAVLNETLRQL